jgi:hypothetical protein
MKYLILNRDKLIIQRSDGDIEIPAAFFTGACLELNVLIDKFEDFGVDVFSLLGMRNLSAFIGELFGAVVINRSSGTFRKNPHQDGYPDLLPMDSVGAALWKSLEPRRGEKEPFSPFAAGGIEIKATCGAVPTPAQLKKKGLTKPEIGTERIDLMRSYDWKAHHQWTNNLLGLLWDFVDTKPRIVACFYSHRLAVADWGGIIKPKEGGGRTTSVSIMTRDGVSKMYKDWLFVADDLRYVHFIDRYNGGSLLADYHKANSTLPSLSMGTGDSPAADISDTK